MNNHAVSQHCWRREGYIRLPDPLCINPYNNTQNIVCYLQLQTDREHNNYTIHYIALQREERNHHVLLYIKSTTNSSTFPASDHPMNSH